MDDSTHVHEINHDDGNEASHDQPVEEVSFLPLDNWKRKLL